MVRNALKRYHCSQEEQALKMKIQQLRGMPQTFFDISVEKISVSCWESVSADISLMDSVQLPCEKLEYLASKLLYLCATVESNFCFSRSKLQNASTNFTRMSVTPAVVNCMTDSPLKHQH